MKKNKTKIDKAESGKRVKESRLAAGMTRQTVADKVFLSVQQIWNIESGRRGLTLENAIAFGDLFGASPDYLLCKDSRVGLDSPERRKIGKRELTVPSRTHLLWEILQRADNYIGCEYKFYHDNSAGSLIRIKTPAGKTIILNHSRQKELLDDILDYTSFRIHQLENNKKVSFDTPNADIISFDTPEGFRAGMDALEKRLQEKGDSNV